MSTRISLLIVIFCLIILPSAIRTFGFYSGEIWRFQQSLGGDKVLHLITGASLTAAFIIIPKALASIRKLVLMFLFASAVLIVEEFFQYLTPGRHFEWIDMLWGLAGASFVFMISLALFVYKKKQISSS